MQKGWLFGKYDYFGCGHYEWEHLVIFKLKIFVLLFFWKKWLVRSRILISGERDRRTPWYHHLSAASNAVTRDYFSHNPTIWSKKFLNLLIKYDLNIALKNENQHRIAEEISNCLYKKISRLCFSNFFDAFHVTNLNLILKILQKKW